MPGWLKVLGLSCLVLLGLTLLGGVTGILAVWLSRFWDAARKGHQKIKPVSEIITGLSYLTICWFLVFACWYEIRFLWRHNKSALWCEIIAVGILASKWWLTHGEYAEKQQGISSGDLTYQDKSSIFYGIDGNEEVRLAERIKNDFAKSLENYGSFIPSSALQYSAEDIKRAFKILSVHDECDEGYRVMLRDGFEHLANICSNSDATLMQSRLSDVGLSELSEQQRNHSYFLLERRNIRCNMLNYEWDDWMLENHIKQSDSYDDIRRQSDALNLTVDDLHDINPGDIPSKEEFISNREQRANNAPPV